MLLFGNEFIGFEFAALALLLANLWFVFGILTALKAIKETAVFLGNRSDRTTNKEHARGGALGRKR